MNCLDRQPRQTAAHILGSTHECLGIHPPPDPFRWDDDCRATARRRVSKPASTDLVSVERATGKLSSRAVVPSTDTGSVEGEMIINTEIIGY